MAKSKFEKVLGELDILVVAFGAMIGWSWVVNTGEWISTAGALGSALAFLIGSCMVLFVGLTYAELTAAIPQCGGELVFSYRAMGANGSYVCTWFLLLAYIGVVCFEACAFPTVISYLFPNFLQGYLYTIAGFDVYATWVATGVAAAIGIVFLNLRGTKTAAVAQTVFTAMIAAAGVLLLIAALVRGQSSNLQQMAFSGQSQTEALGGILTVAVMTPFLYLGFDIIPQTAEEIAIPYRKTGKLMVLSILLATAFYILVILAVAYGTPQEVISQSMADPNGLVTADAMSWLFGSTLMGKLLIIGGLAGIVTSWNSFLIGGSRVLFAMAEAHMVPRPFAKLHPRFHTPSNAIALIGLISAIAPFFGRKMLIWLLDAGSFGTVIAYFMVSMSFLILRRKAPDLHRPYRVRHGKVVGKIALVISGLMCLLYIIPLPFSSSALCHEEWGIVGIWVLLGIGFYLHSRKKYGAEFGAQEEIEPDKTLQ